MTSLKYLPDEEQAQHRNDRQYDGQKQTHAAGRLLLEINGAVRQRWWRGRLLLRLPCALQCVVNQAQSIFPSNSRTAWPIIWKSICERC